MTENPLISIITPSLNRAEMIVTAIESVLAQNYPHFEHIIVDGGSTDGTVDLLKRYPHLKVLAGHDKGMYDALNRGLELAKGKIIGFLNSDDLYAVSIFAIIAEKFQNQNTLAVAGEALVFLTTPNGETQIIKKFSPESASLLKLSTIGVPFFNAWFFRRSVFEKIGNFNIKYQIVGDREFMLRFALSGLKYTTVDKLVYQYCQHADSMTFGTTDQKMERKIDEHISMTSSYLEQKNLSIEARNLIRKLRTRDTMFMAYRSLKKRNFHKFSHYLQRGIEHDPLWFLHLPRRIKH